MDSSWCLAVWLYFSYTVYKRLYQYMVKVWTVLGDTVHPFLLVISFLLCLAFMNLKRYFLMGCLCFSDVYNSATCILYAIQYRSTYKVWRKTAEFGAKNYYRCLDFPNWQFSYQQQPTYKPITLSIVNVHGVMSLLYGQLSLLHFCSLLT